MVSNVKKVRALWESNLLSQKKKYDIRVGRKADKVSSARIAIIVSESFMKTFSDKVRDIASWGQDLEADAYAAAMALKLKCNELDRERDRGYKIDGILKINTKNKGKTNQVIDLAMKILTE